MSRDNHFYLNSVTVNWHLNISTRCTYTTNLRLSVVLGPYIIREIFSDIQRSFCTDGKAWYTSNFNNEQSLSHQTPSFHISRCLQNGPWQASDSFELPRLSSHHRFVRQLVRCGNNTNYGNLGWNRHAKSSFIDHHKLQITSNFMRAFK